MFGIDHSSHPPAPHELVKEGVRFVCRYVSSPGNPKNISRGEADALKLAGIEIVLVFETFASEALRGRTAGARDAAAASAQASTVGLVGAPIYFAVDFDASLADQKAINQYLAGAASIIAWSRVGVYGGYYVVKRALDARACRYAWQTYAWSGGQWDPRCHLRQYLNGQRLAGISVDFDHSFAADFGQAVRPTPPVPVPVRRRRLRAWILNQRAHGRTWTALKKTVQWRLWRRLGGR